jgi:UDP-N-acetylmuramate--alanine ligase
VNAAARPWGGRTLHFVGVAGAGMSGYARAARALGARVSGSDRQPSEHSERLAADGVLEAQIGEHDAVHLPFGDDVEVVYSSAVAPENPERAAARARGLRERSRAQLLAELSALRATIAVAGTHGKTTTAAMLVHALRASGLHPDWLIGGAIGPGEANAQWSEAGDWLVIEADESDRSMLDQNFEIAVLTNVELDHHATFSSLSELRGAFREFLARARSAIVIWDHDELLELAPAGVRIVPYDVREPSLADGGSRFRWHGRDVALAVPGAHNALNASAALEAAALAGADDALAIAGLQSFTGAGRRFQLVGTSKRGARIYEDYAHHPTEVSATLAAASTLAHARLIAVLQPHLYSRTRALARELGLALITHADLAVVLDVYPARERAQDYPGVSGLLVAEAAADAAAGRPVYWLPTFADAELGLGPLLDRGDLCIVMGAGDVGVLARALVKG